MVFLAADGRGDEGESSLEVIGPVNSSLFQIRKVHSDTRNFRKEQAKGQ